MWLLKDEKSQIKRFPQEEEGVKISYKCQQLKKIRKQFIEKAKIKNMTLKNLLKTPVTQHT